jgi:hypothetical protein
LAAASSAGAGSVGAGTIVSGFTAAGASIGGLWGNYKAANEVAEKTGEVIDTTLNDGQLMRAIESLSIEYAEGSIRDKDAMKQRLIFKGVNEDEAEILAREFSADATQLLKIGQMLSTVEKQQEAAYDAVAQAAFSLANTLGMTQEEI